MDKRGKKTFQGRREIWESRENEVMRVFPLDYKAFFYKHYDDMLKNSSINERTQKFIIVCTHPTSRAKPSYKGCALSNVS